MATVTETVTMEIQITVVMATVTETVTVEIQITVVMATVTETVTMEIQITVVMATINETITVEIFTDHMMNHHQLVAIRLMHEFSRERQPLYCDVINGKQILFN